MKVGVNSGLSKSKLFMKHRIKTSSALIAKILIFLKIPFVWDIKG